jgi:hypothetical protein
MFRVGALKYGVKIPRDRMTVDRKECLGLCDEYGRRFLISPAVPIDRRLWTLAHEIAHGHFLATGVPSDVEGLCDLFATMFEMTMRDLVNAGGEEALKRLDPGEELGTATGKIGLTLNRACSRCRGTIAGGSVQCTPTGDGHVELRAVCRHCDVTLIWRELATHGGHPSGVMVGEARFVRGAEDALAVAAGELRYVACDW